MSLMYENSEFDRSFFKPAILNFSLENRIIFDVDLLGVFFE